MTTPRSALVSRASSATAGVGTVPARAIRAPADVIPAINALSIKSPEMRVSRPMTTVGRVVELREITSTAAEPMRAIVSGTSGGRFAMPRMPSVPKRLGKSVMGNLSGVTEDGLGHAQRLVIFADIVHAEDAHTTAAKQRRKRHGRPAPFLHGAAEE